MNGKPHRAEQCEIDSPMLVPAAILIPMPMPAPVKSDPMAPKSRVPIGVGELS